MFYLADKCSTSFNSFRTMCCLVFFYTYLLILRSITSLQPNYTKIYVLPVNEVFIYIYIYAFKNPFNLAIFEKEAFGHHQCLTLRPPTGSLLSNRSYFCLSKRTTKLRNYLSFFLNNLKCVLKRLWREKEIHFYL